MRVFLAGATGVIGIRVLPLLASEGHVVAAMTRSADKADHLLALGGEPIVCDVYDLETLTTAVGAFAPEAVMHQLTDLPDTLDELAQKGSAQRPDANRRNPQPDRGRAERGRRPLRRSKHRLATGQGRRSRRTARAAGARNRRRHRPLRGAVWTRHLLRGRAPAPPAHPRRGRGPRNTTLAGRTSRDQLDRRAPVTAEEAAPQGSAARPAPAWDGASMEQSGRKRPQVTANRAAARPAQLLANCPIRLHTLADDPRW